MSGATLTMSKKELERLEVVQRCLAGRLRQAAAGKLLGLGERQVQRLCRAYQEGGPAGLVSKKRGRVSNRRLDDDLRREVLELVRSKYADFGPTLACEKLEELHHRRVSRETLRRWMVEDGLWVPRKLRRRVQQPRRRRPCVGELIQIDGSDHEWFEDRSVSSKLWMKAGHQRGSRPSKCSASWLRARAQPWGGRTHFRSAARTAK